MIITDMTWDSTLDFYGFKSGLRYNNGVWGGQLTFGNILDLDIHNSAYDVAVNRSEATAHKLTLIEFPNDTSLIAKIWNDGPDNNYKFHAKYFFYNNRTNQDIHNFDPYGDGGLETTGNLVKYHYPSKFFLYMDYFDANDPPAPSSRALGLYFNLIFPTVSGADLNSLMQFDTYHNEFIPLYRAQVRETHPLWENIAYDYPITPTGLLYGITDTDTDFFDYIKTINGGFTPQIDIGNGDPIQEEDPSGPGGGEGNYDDSSDPIDFPSLPTGGALSSGAIKGFHVSAPQLAQVFNKLWNSSIFDIATQFQKLVDNPMDCVISLHCVPVRPTTSGSANIKMGSFDTEISADVISNQYLSIDCGSLTLKEYWGSALDYSPYSKVELYMPFVGIKELKIEDVMKSTVHIKYNIDVFTGDCLCNVKCGQSVLYKFAGSLKQDIPVSGRTNNMGIKAMIGAAASFAGGAMGAAMGAPPVLAGVAAGISSAVSVATSKIITTRSGSLSGSVGLLDDFVPYLIFHRPIQSLAENFKGHKGYPSNITVSLGNLNGYTEVEYINLQNIPNATSAEMDEIKSLLKQGVIF